MVEPSYHVDAFSGVRSRESALPLRLRLVDQTDIQLVIETTDGTFIRSVRPATVLPEGARGYAAEDATRSAAAYWGLPDFVFRSAQSSRGSGTREVGDALVVVGSIGAAVQVKAREQLTSDRAKERRWLDKHIDQAIRQGRGTIRTLTASHGVTLVNERGRDVLVTGRDKTWVVVVVLDHPGFSDYVPPKGAVVLIRRDWEFLFEQLKSTHAVVEYVQRVCDENDPVALGDEAVRYYQLAAADAAMPPASADLRIAHLGSRWSGPSLSRPPAGHADQQHFTLLRAWLEDVATAPLSENVTQQDMLDVLAAVDTTPIEYRAELGKALLSWLREVAQTPDGETSWRFRSVIGSHSRPYLIFAAATRHDQAVQAAFSGFVRLRHAQHLELMPERRGLLTAGILLTPRKDRFGPWDTTLVATREEALNPEDRVVAERFWGRIGESRILA